MIAFALYLTAVLFGAAGLCGHTPVLTRLARHAYRPWTSRGSRGSRVAPIPLRPARARTTPSWARTGHGLRPTNHTSERTRRP